MATTEVFWRITYWLANVKKPYSAAHQSEQRMLAQVKQFAVGSQMERAIAHKIIRGPKGWDESVVETRKFDPAGRETSREARGL
jgi:hypothetical protein